MIKHTLSFETEEEYRLFLALLDMITEGLEPRRKHLGKVAETVLDYAINRGWEPPKYRMPVTHGRSMLDLWLKARAMYIGRTIDKEADALYTVYEVKGTGERIAVVSPLITNHQSK